MTRASALSAAAERERTRLVSYALEDMALVKRSSLSEHGDYTPHGQEDRARRLTAVWLALWARRPAVPLEMGEAQMLYRHFGAAFEPVLHAATTRRFHRERAARQEQARQQLLAQDRVRSAP